MADTTSASRSLSADETADELEALASELRTDNETVNVAVGNKSVSLTPGEPVDYEIKVDEHEPMLGDKRESITVELSWKTND